MITREQLKSDAIKNAMAYNKHLTNAYLNKLSFTEILCFVHPMDRGDYIIDFNKLNRKEN